VVEALAEFRFDPEIDMLFLLHTHDDNSPPQNFTVAESWDSIPRLVIPVGRQYTPELLPILKQLQPDTPVVIQSLDDRRLTGEDRALMRRLGLTGGILISLLVYGGWVGAIFLAKRNGRAFSPQTVSFYQAAASGIALWIHHPARAQREQTTLRNVIQAERDQLEAILEATNDAVIMFNRDQQVVLANVQFEAFFGVSRYVLLTRKATELGEVFKGTPYYPGELLHLLVSLQSTASAAAQGEFELQLPTRRTLRWFSMPVISADGLQIGRLCVFRDATSEREADRVKADFVSLISHQLRTPLTSIQGFTELILDGEAGEITPIVREYLQIVQASSYRLTSIVNDILDVTQFEARRLAIRMGRVDLYDLIPDTVMAFHPQAELKQQTIEARLPRELPSAWADSSRLTQILNNLITNALTHTPHGGKIVVDARYAETFGALPPSAPDQVVTPALLIGVHDNGMGIDPADQPLLFTRFYRTPQTIRLQLSGLGLGLFLVRSLVELHNGTVWVHSQLNAGASFYFTLPPA
jgi:signal transduction histidine kinase